jgi:hypothetical protein
VLFSGSRGAGNRAVLIFDDLFKQGRLQDLPELARYNPNTFASGDAVVFGVTSVVEQNFAKLLNSGQLKNTQQYLQVDLNYNDTDKQWELNLKQCQRLEPEKWQETPLRTFRGDSQGNWKVAGS